MTDKNHKVRKVWVGVKINADGSEEYVGVPDLTNPEYVLPMSTSEETVGTEIFPRVADKLNMLTGASFEVREFYDYEVTHRVGAKRQ